MNRRMLFVGAVLFLLGAAINAIVQGGSGFSIDPIGGGVFGFAAFLGLILIVAGALRSDRPASGQQQQQQIVVYTQPAAPETETPMNLRCRACQTLSESDAHYCMQCGTGFGATDTGTKPRRNRRR